MRTAGCGIFPGGMLGPADLFGVAGYILFRLKELESVPNSVPNPGVRGEWRG